MWHTIGVEITGSKQGLFHGDDRTGKPGAIPCFSVKLAAKKKNDAGRQGAVHSSATASSNKPVALLLRWGPSSPQCWDAYWSNEVLTSVSIVAHYGDGSGATNTPFKKILLTNATIVGIKHKLDTPDDAAVSASIAPVGTPLFGALLVRFRYEQIEIHHPESQTQAHHGAALPTVPSIIG